MRGFGVPVLVLLHREPQTENQLRMNDVPYHAMLTALSDLEQAGFIEKRFQSPKDGRRRASGVGRWYLTENGVKVANALVSAGDIMDLLDRGGSDWNFHPKYEPEPQPSEREYDGGDGTTEL